MSALPEEGKTYKDSNTSESYKFTFKYTAGVAVVGTTADNGQTTYYAVVSLTPYPDPRCGRLIFTYNKRGAPYRV